MAKTETTKTFKLSEPLKYEGKTFTEVTLSQPRVRDVIAAQKFKTPAEQTVAMFASVSGVPIGAIHDMTLEDFAALEAWFAPFASGATRKPSGATSSA